MIETEGRHQGRHTESLQTHVCSTELKYSIACMLRLVCGERSLEGALDLDVEHEDV